MFYQNLYKTIADGAPLKETPEHGYDVINLIEMAFESSRLKCTLKVG